MLKNTVYHEFINVDNNIMLDIELGLIDDRRAIGLLTDELEKCSETIVFCENIIDNTHKELYQLQECFYLII